MAWLLLILVWEAGCIIACCGYGMLETMGVQADLLMRGTITGDQAIELNASFMAELEACSSCNKDMWGRAD